MQHFESHCPSQYTDAIKINSKLLVGVTTHLQGTNLWTCGHCISLVAF